MSRNFDRVLGFLKGLSNVEEAGPTTIQDMIPMVGEVTTVIAQMVRENDMDEHDRIIGSRFTLFLQTIEPGPNGPEAIQVVIPDKAVRRIVGMHERLNSRKRSLARERARERARAILHLPRRSDDDEDEAIGE